MPLSHTLAEVCKAPNEGKAPRVDERILSAEEVGLPPCYDGVLPRGAQGYFLAFLRTLPEEHHTPMVEFLTLLREVRGARGLEEEWEVANHKRFKALHEKTPLPLLVERYRKLPRTAAAFRSFYEKYEDFLLMERLFPPALLQRVDIFGDPRWAEEEVQLSPEEVLQEALLLLPLVPLFQEAISGSSWFSGAPDWMTTRYGEVSKSPALYAAKLASTFTSPSARRLLREGRPLLLQGQDPALTRIFLKVLTAPQSLFAVPRDAGSITVHRERLLHMGGAYVVQLYLDALPLQEVLSTFTLFEGYRSLEEGGITFREALYYLDHRHEVEGMPPSWWRPLAAAALPSNN